VSPIITELLAKRGIVGEEAIEAFLKPTLAALAKPEELPGVVEAADIILDAISGGKEIVVFGDYDCDGVCATAILLRAISAIRENAATAFLPDRLNEGYGMSDISVSRMLRMNPRVSLVITVDNGINSIEQVARLRDRGVSVVVTDHHLPSHELDDYGRDGDMMLPDANAIVNPKVEAPESLKDICGAFVAFLLANRLVSEAKRREMYSGPCVGGPLLVLAGLATVTDIMPLLGQNRIVVAEAIRRFQTLAPIGLRELYLRASRSGSDRMTGRDFGFMLGPRINAAGRLASGAEALELLLTEDVDIAHECARIVNGYNDERKKIEQRMSDEAAEKIIPGAAAQVIDLPNGHPGVAGIVAARVMEKLGGTVPVCVIAGGHGSARSPAHINIRDAFVACADTLERYGGHAAAGGFSVKYGLTDRFRGMLCGYCAAFKQDGEEKPTEHLPEFWIEPNDVTLALAEEIRALEPFGEANREPEFGFRNATISEARALGQEGRHLLIQVNGLKAIWWGHAEEIERIRARGTAATWNITFTIEVNDYQERHAELRVTSISEALA